MFNYLLKKIKKRKKIKSNLTKLTLLAVLGSIALVACSDSRWNWGWGLRNSTLSISYRPLDVIEEVEGRHLKEPHGLAIDKRNGNLLVSDTGNQRVIVFDQDGKFIRQFGKKGDGPGEFSHPMDVAVAPDGSIYVSDYFQDRIQKFTSQGEYLLEWGASGEGQAQFNAPTGLAVDHSGNVYVADFYNSVIKVFNFHGQYLRTIGSPGQFGPRRLDYPTDVDVNVNGTVVVADAYNYRIQSFSAYGSSSAWGWHLLWLFPRPGDGTQGFKVPTGTTFGPNGRLIHVADGGNHRVVTLDSQGAFLGAWSLPDIDLDKDAQTYNSPVAVAAKRDGTAIYVADVVNSRVIILGIKHEAEMNEQD